MPKLRVHNLAVSLDGYAAGPAQSVDNPLGVGGDRLHEWVFATRSGRKLLGLDGGDEGIDDDFMAAGDAGIGATIMGRNMFGPVRGPWGSEQWTGWWGDDPPFHHPVFVLTHHPRPPITVAITCSECPRQGGLRPTRTRWHRRHPRSDIVSPAMAPSPPFDA